MIRFLYIDLFILLIYYCFVPFVYDWASVSVSFTLSAFSFYCYIKHKKFDNYLSFELLFLVTLFLLYYLYPLFIYSEDTAYLFSFGLHYNVDYISQGVCIASIGIVSFMIGNCTLKNTIKLKKEKEVTTYFKSNVGLSLFCTILYILYYALGGFQHFVDIYKYGVRESTSSSYVLVLIQCAFPLLLFNELWNRKRLGKAYHYSLYSILISLMVACHFFIVGSRTNALLIFLSFIVIYAEFFFKQPLKNLLFFFFCGIILMWLLQISRSNSEVNVETFQYYFLFSDFIIPNTDTYIAAEVVDEQGCTLGLSVLSQFLSIIPFAQNFIYTLFDISITEASSSHFFTDYLGSTAGMGTNVVADLYLAFDLIGVVAFMYFLGRVSAVWKARMEFNYYSALMYSVLSGLSIYLARASMFYALRMFLFTIILSIIFSPTKKCTN